MNQTEFQNDDSNERIQNRRRRSRKYYQRNRERILTVERERYRQNIDERRESQKVYREKNREEIRAQQQRYRQNHREICANRLKKVHHDLKIQVLSHYSGGKPVCGYCGFDDVRALSIDHVGGAGLAHRRTLSVTMYYWLRNSNYPEGYQVLCMNCQFIKRRDNRECSGKEPGKFAKYTKKYNRVKKVQVLSHYSGKKLCCCRCGFDELPALSIDHVSGNGAQHARQIGIPQVRLYDWLRDQSYPEGFQVLCMNCQFIKRNENREYRTAKRIDGA